MTHEETCRELRGHAASLKAQVISRAQWCDRVQQTMSHRYPNATGPQPARPGAPHRSVTPSRTDTMLDIRNLAVARSRAPGQSPAAAPAAR